MTVIVDAQLSPLIACWLANRFGVEAMHVSEAGLLLASDHRIFGAFRASDSVVLTKDRDFVDLVERLGTPPQILWLTCGNTSNARLRAILAAGLPDAMRLLNDGEPIVEISDIGF